ncbi:signal peptidase I [Apibacter muscae]|uniref:Signal peptidase I n=1 Tax=Apibacter muscae TaxID=2509004 RepID=A0A563D9K1_9FLAO|nr:signal peptidase I [Apibacter muscae]TWP26601.1 signal peptidase I [Apibacter muscae]
MNLLQYYLIFGIITNILYFLTTWKLFQKAGRKAWESLIPVYNLLVTIKIIHRPWWWIFIVFIPIVGPIMTIIILVDFISHYNRRSWMDALLVVLFSFVFLAYINYSPQTKYIDKIERKETLISAVLFAVIFATVIHTFIIQPFTIPTGSMERTLLVGDFLFVNKIKYGIRLPMTPVALPFLQNKIPLGDSSKPQHQTNSYIDNIRLPYFRLPGWTDVKRGDIVVFNYPTDSLHTAIDRKDPYVKRAVGVPGDILEIKDANLYVNGKLENIKKDEEQQRRYNIYTNESGISPKKIDDLLGYAPYFETQSEIRDKRKYTFEGLTTENLNLIKNLNTVDSVAQDIAKVGVQDLRINAYGKIDTAQSIFPINKHWNRSQYGPIQIPRKGDVIHLNHENIEQYRDIITRYENNDLKIVGNQFYINGTPTDNYTIKQNYYWMMGDNRDNSLDSRYFGYVPENHIIGSPVFTWLSIQGLFENTFKTPSGEKVDGYGHKAKFKIRWDRMFKIPNTDTLPKDKTSYLPYFIVLLIAYFSYDYFKKKKKKKLKNQ